MKIARTCLSKEEKVITKEAFGIGKLLDQMKIIVKFFVCAIINPSNLVK